MAEWHVLVHVQTNAWRMPQTKKMVEDFMQRMEAAVGRMADAEVDAARMCVCVCSHSITGWACACVLRMLCEGCARVCPYHNHTYGPVYDPAKEHNLHSCIHHLVYVHTSHSYLHIKLFLALKPVAQMNATVCLHECDSVLARV